MPSAHDTILSYVTGPPPNSLAARMAQEDSSPPVPTTRTPEDADSPSLSPPPPSSPKRQVHTTSSLGLKYMSIKSINMPPRPGFIPDLKPPAPVAGTFPFGDTEDHQSSMMIHWLDELEYTYATTTRLYVNMFPRDRITDEAIRRRHMRSLERLVGRYGRKDERQIGPVGRIVEVRGRARTKSRARRETGSSLYGADAVINETDADAATDADSHMTDTEHMDATLAHQLPTQNRRPTVTRQTLREKDNQKTRVFDKACIVVWRDADGMSFRDIREKLDRERGWSLGEPTVKKYYSRVRDHVWGVGGGEEEEEVEGEDGDGNTMEI